MTDRWDTPEVKLWKATDLKGAEQPKFLAKNRIPRAAITILIGEEGIGKSLLWILWASAVTTGKPMPEFGIPARDPAYVHIIVTEDEWKSVVRPRLEVAGTDLDYIRMICADEDGGGSPTFPDDMERIVEADPAPALVVCDAWLDTVPRRLQVRDPQQSRQALHPWKEAANLTGAAIVLLAHTNRLASANIRDRYGATASLRMKARSTLYCLHDDGDLLVGPDKANSSSGRTRAGRFRIKAVQHFEPTEDHDGTVPLLEFVCESDKTIKQHLNDAIAAEKAKARPPSEIDQWLSDFLAGGAQRAIDVYEAGAKSEYEWTPDQLKRAKKRICGPAFHKTDDPTWWWQSKSYVVANFSSTEGGENGEG